MKNNTDALKRAIMEGMNTILSAIDSIDAAAPQRKPKSNKPQKAPKAKFAPTPAPAPVKKNRKKKPGCYRIEDLQALYFLADKQLLHYIKGTAASTEYPGSYVYLVEKNPETREALAAFLTQEEIHERL